MAHRSTRSARGPAQARADVPGRDRTSGAASRRRASSHGPAVTLRDDGIADLIEAVRLAHVPDFRSGVFDVQATPRGRDLVLSGQCTHPEAVQDLLHRLRTNGVRAIDQVVRLPDPLPARFESAALSEQYSRYIDHLIAKYR